MFVKIAASLLACDAAALGDEAEAALRDGADWLHVDVMDGHFAPNLALGPAAVAALRQRLGPRAVLDCHLMVREPLRWTPVFAAAGASSVTVHVEALSGPAQWAEVATLAGRSQAALAVSPATPVSALEPFIAAHPPAHVLVMTVEPGFGGQALLAHCVDKVRELGARHPGLVVQVDGGVCAANAGELVAAGATVLVAGSSIFKRGVLSGGRVSYADAVSDLRRAT